MIKSIPRNRGTRVQTAAVLAVACAVGALVLLAFAPSSGQAAAPFGGNPNKRLSIYDGTILVDGTASVRIGNAGRDLEASGRLYLRANGSERGSFVEGAPGAVGQRLELTGGLNGQHTLAATWTGTAGQSETQGAVQGHFHGAFNGAVGAAVYGEVTGCGSGMTCYAGYFSGGVGNGVSALTSGSGQAQGDFYWQDIGLDGDLLGGHDFYSSTVYDNKLIAGGYFSSAGAIYQWDGADWTMVGTGMEGTGYHPEIHALTVYNGELIAGGRFTGAGGNPAAYIAKWNGSAWSPLGSGLNGNVFSLTVYNNELIAGGDFTQAGGAPANRIAKWNGSAWSPLGSGLDGNVVSLTVYNNELIAGGDFTQAGGAPANRIAKWNGSNWSALGSGMDDTVDAFIVKDGELVIGGYFTTVNGQSANRIAKWNGSAWSTFDTGMNGGILSLNVFRNELVALGGFSTAGGSTVYDIAKWTDSRGNWSAGMDANGKTDAFTVYNDELIATGNFVMIGGVEIERIAKWNGSAWSALRGGLGNFGKSLTVYQDELVVGGYFNAVDNGGVSARRIAKWNGSAWSALGAGIGNDVNDVVNALTVYNGELIAAGDFDIASGVAVDGIAKWNGTAWSALGAASFDGPVKALEVYQGSLYAVDYDNLYRWNGSAWSAPFRPPNSGPAFISLGVYQNELVVGGNFTDGSAPYEYMYLAKFDGTNWSPIGTGLDGEVHSWTNVNALTEYDGELIIGGNFDSAGGPHDPVRPEGFYVNDLVKWDGSTWSALTYGIQSSPPDDQNDHISAFGVYRGELFVGGNFDLAGGMPAAALARWTAAGGNGKIPAVRATNNDPAGLAALFDGTFSAGLWDMSGNVRGTCDWVAAPPNELVCPDGRLLSGVQSDCPVDSCLTAMYCCEL